jgi:hypothetical protein
LYGCSWQIDTHSRFVGILRLQGIRRQTLAVDVGAVMLMGALLMGDLDVLGEFGHDLIVVDRWCAALHLDVSGELRVDFIVVRGWCATFLCRSWSIRGLWGSIHR